MISSSSAVDPKISGIQVDDQGHVIGIVTEKDLIVSFRSEGTFLRDTI